MWAFFHGWRRKMGCVTLVMALVFMLGWIRSEVVYDFVNLGGDETSCTFGSMGGGFKFFWKTPSSRSGFRWETGKLSNIGQYKINGQGQRAPRDRWENYDVEWRWDEVGFHFGAAVLPTDGVRQTVRIESYELPYWSITIPLTFLSAYLILWKPRKRDSRPPQSSDGTENEAVQCLTDL